MGKHFGNLQNLKGVIFYTLSPHEVKPFKGLFVPGITNTIRRIKENVVYMGVPFLIYYTVFSECMKDYHRRQRKNPDDFKDDV